MTQPSKQPSETARPPRRAGVNLAGINYRVAVINDRHSPRACGWCARNVRSSAGLLQVTEDMVPVKITAPVALFVTVSVPEFVENGSAPPAT